MKSFSGLLPGLIFTLFWVIGNKNFVVNSHFLKSPKGKVDCPNIEFPSTEIVDATTAIIKFQNNPAIDTIDFRWREGNTEEWVVLQTIDSLIRLESLKECSHYEYQFRSICADSSTSFGNIFQFQSGGCCLLPMKIDYEANELGDIVVKWTNVAAAEQFLFEYKPYDEVFWNATFISDSFFVISNLEVCSAFDVRIKTICESKETIYSMNKIVKNDCGDCSNDMYCEFPPKNNDFEWIDEIEFADNKNISGRDLEGKGDFTGIINFNLEPGAEYDFSIKIGNMAAAFEENIKAWIDFNRDFIFTPDEEILGLDSAVIKEFAGTVQIPANSTPGLARMRIVLAFSAIPDPCGTSLFNFGESEEYCVNIVDISSTCDRKHEITLQNSMQNNAQLSWDSNPEAIAYSIVYAEIEGSVIYQQITLDTFIRLESLIPCTEYEAYIGNICKEDTSSSTPFLFKTACSTSVSFDKFEKPNTFTISPNPFQEEFQIFSNTINPNDVEILLFNSDGKQVKAFKKQFNSNLNMTIHMQGDIPEGIYFLRISSGNKFVIKKIVKL